MVEFIDSIIKWFEENKESILVFLTSGTFITLVTQVVMMIRQLVDNKNAKKRNDKFNDSLGMLMPLLEDTSKLNGSVGDANSTIFSVKSDLDKFKSETVDSIDTILVKLNAILEVQSIVYSTIKDEHIRAHVNNILLDAKFAETSTRAELEAEIERLKGDMIKSVEAVKDTIETATEIVSKSVSPVSNHQSTIERY